MENPSNWDAAQLTAAATVAYVVLTGILAVGAVIAARAAHGQLRELQKSSESVLKIEAERGLWSGDDKDQLLVTIHNVGARGETILTVIVGDDQRRATYPAARTPVARDGHATVRIPIDLLTMEWPDNLHQMGTGARIEILTASGGNHIFPVSQSLLVGAMAQAYLEAVEEFAA